MRGQRVGWLRIVAVAASSLSIVGALFWATELGIQGDLPWRAAALFGVTTLGSVLALKGVVSWYGPGAQGFRIAGAIVMLGAGLVNVSFAFVFVPLAILVAFSLGRKRHGAAQQQLQGQTAGSNERVRRSHSDKHWPWRNSRIAMPQ